MSETKPYVPLQVADYYPAVVRRLMERIHAEPFSSVETEADRNLI